MEEYEQSIPFAKQNAKQNADEKRFSTNVEVL